MLPPIGHDQIGAETRAISSATIAMSMTLPPSAAVFFGKRQREQPGLDPCLVELVGIGRSRSSAAHVFGRRVLVASACARCRAAASALGEAEIHAYLPRRSQTGFSPPAAPYTMPQRARLGPPAGLAVLKVRTGCGKHEASGLNNERERRTRGRRVIYLRPSAAFQLLAAADHEKIVCDRDVAVTMRDGVNIMVDLYGRDASGPVSGAVCLQPLHSKELQGNDPSSISAAAVVVELCGSATRRRAIPSSSFRAAMCT